MPQAYFRELETAGEDGNYPAFLVTGERHFSFIHHIIATHLREKDQVGK